MQIATRLCLLVILLLVGCRPSADRAKPTNTLIYGRGEDAETLDPINAETGETVKVLVNIYDTLVAFDDETLDVVPSIATSWETSEDGLEWTFKVRDGVTFHDGTPCDADAVVFSLQRILQDDHPHVHDPARPYKPTYQVIDDVSAPDPTTVLFKLRQPSAVFLNNLAMFPASIVSPTAVKERGAAFATNPSGTGPFRFVRWARDQQIVLEASDHWRGRPKVDRLVFVPVSESATRVQQLKRGEIHIADNLPPAELDALATEPGITVQEQVALNVAYLAMHVEKPPLDDVRVRQAIWHALDKERLIRVAYSGHATPAVNLLPRNMWGHHDGIEDRRFDVEAAKKLLQEAADEKGFALPLQLSLSVMSQPRPYMEQPLQVATFVKDSLAEIGVELTVDPTPPNVHFPKMMQGEYQIGLAGWTTDNGDPDNFLHTLLDIDNISDHGNNMSRYRNEDMHEVLIEAQRELVREKREALYHQAQEMIFADAPVIPLVSTQQRVAQRSIVKGYRAHPITIVRLRHAYLEAAP